MSVQTRDPRPDIFEEDISAAVLNVHVLAFPPHLERLFEDQDRSERVRHLVRSGVIGLILFDLFLVYDWQLVPDVMEQACVLRLGVFTPLFLFTLLVPTRSRSALLREGCWAVIPIVATALVMALMLQSGSPYRLPYHYGTVLIMVFATVVQRLRFRFAVVANLGTLVVILGAVSTSDLFDARMRAADLIVFLTAAILLAAAAYALEREQRLAFLSDLKIRALNERLDYLAKIDPLTGLWNRRYLDDLGSANEDFDGAEMAVVLVDVDHFKAFNDAYGHLAGDSCLREVGRCLADAAQRHRGAAVRFGGEEFLLFIPDLGDADAALIAEEIRQAVHSLAIAHRCAPLRTVTVSVGFCVGPRSQDPKTAIRAADEALYLAKSAGRDRVSGPPGTVGPAFATAA